MKLVIPFLFLFISSFSQSISRKSFFEDETVVSLAISVSLKNIDQPTQVDVKRPAMAKLVLANDSAFTGPIQLHARGKSRLALCDPPPLMLYFKTKMPSQLSNLGKLKLVWACNSSDYYDQLILKEYIIYKMYNLLTPYSFRVRLANVGVYDSSKAGKTYNRMGFLIEDIDDLAKRLNGKEFGDLVLQPGQVEQYHYALVTIFEYMIANTDWSISNFQNIKMVSQGTIGSMPPILVPYDFDNSGLVNAIYAVPFETLPIDNVRTRYNRATSLSIGDIDSASQVILSAKPAIISLIENTEGLKLAQKKEMVNYLNEFFGLMDDKKAFNKIFLKQ